MHGAGRAGPALAVLLCLALTVLGTTSCSRQDVAEEMPQDARFAAFTENLPDNEPPPAVQTDLEPVVRRVPGMHVLSAHFATQYVVTASRLPSPDTLYWFHLVMTVEHADAQVLADASTQETGLLPAVYPDLHQYVPQECAFRTVPTHPAEQILQGEYDGQGSGSTPDPLIGVEVNDLAVSTDCDLVVATLSTWSM